jgi:formylmethanofuran dehydrogenase subunit E
MRSSSLSQEMIEQTIRFHGHSCPGLAIGMRVAELALNEFGHAADEEVVAVVETDMCAVDAVQFLMGCTFGKGNLVHLDYGKNAFSFYRRSDGKGLRIVVKPELFQTEDDLVALQKKAARSELSAEEKERLETSRKGRIKKIMESDLKNLFEVKPHEGPVPRRARILESLACESCGERAMESRTRRLMGKTVCIPCFEVLEKRFHS